MPGEFVRRRRCGVRGVAAVGHVRLPERPLLHLRVVLQRIAGDERRRRLLRIDQRRAFLRVRLRQQPLAGHLHERRIGVVGVAIRIRELHRLGDGVQVIRAGVAHRLQVEVLEDVERLQQHRPLAAEAVLVDGVAAIGRLRRLLDARVVLGEVARVERRAVLLQERHHLARRCRPCRSDRARRRCRRAGPSPSRRARPRPCACSVRASAGSLIVSPGLYCEPSGFSQYFLLSGPALEELQLPLDRPRGAVAHREAVLGIRDGRRRDLLEAHRAPLLEHGQRGVQRAGHHGGIEPRAVERLLARQVPVDVDRLRRPALADDRGDLVFFLRIDEHERFAAEAVEILLEDAAGDERRDAGVERVAALQQDAERGRGRERMTGGHATGRSHHRGPQRRSRGLPILDRHLPARSGTAKNQQATANGDLTIPPSWQSALLASAGLLLDGRLLDEVELRIFLLQVGVAFVGDRALIRHVVPSVGLELVDRLPCPTITWPNGAKPCGSRLELSP